MTKAVLSLKNVSIQFGGLKAVDKLSLQIKEGEIFGLIGPNGAGKTTVFNCITQFYKADQGQIIFNAKNGKNYDLCQEKVHDVIKLGLVRTFQNVEVVKELSVLDNVLIGAHIKYKSNFLQLALKTKKARQEEAEMKAKAISILNFLGIAQSKDLLAASLPYGVLKKLELARALMSEPKLIILDEPAAGLNDAETITLIEQIRAIRREYNCSILLVEHDMRLVMDLCEQICVISFGKFVASGSPAEIQANRDVQEAYLGTEL